MMETVQGRKRFGDARTAAADAFEKAGNPILGAVEAAAAFTAVMAFNSGGVVPGVGSTDTVPAMLTPGEAVIPKEVVQAATGQLSGGGGDTHYHMTAHFAPTVHAIDGDGVDKMLSKHAAKFESHMTNAIRKMNRG